MFIQNVSGNIVPGEKGQVTVKIDQGNLFIVSGYNGNPNAGFMCLYTQTAEFYHSG